MEESAVEGGRRDDQDNGLHVESRSMRWSRPVRASLVRTGSCQSGRV